MNAHRYNIYVAWNQGAFLLLFWRQFAPCSHGAASVMEEEVRMPEHDIQWNQYPTVAEDPTARGWLTMQAGRNLAKHNGRNVRPFDGGLPAVHGAGRDPAGAGHARASCRVRARLAGPDESAPAESRSPRVRRRIVQCDRAVAAVSRPPVLRPSRARRRSADEPVGRMHWRRRYGHWPGDAPLVRRHRKLPWIPTEEQWQAILAAMQRESPESRDVCAVVRRGVAPAGDRPSEHWRSRSRASTGARPG